MTASDSAYAINVRFYPAYKACISATAWLPVFFLYFNSRLGVADVIKLEVIYYMAVVFLEVPSGYLSDRIGRRKTLLLACSCLVLAYICFLFLPTFTGLALGQIFLAAGIASQSGTDTALHYESLRALGREQEYGQREARAERIGFIARAVAVLIGGFVGAVALRWPYLLSMVGALMAFTICFKFADTLDVEARAEQQTDASFYANLLQCLAILRSPRMAWLSGFFVVIYAITHVPYEFYQPYLKLTYTDNDALQPSIVSGCIFATTSLIASLFAGYSVTIARRTGLVTLLFAAAILELLVVLSLALWLNPVLAFVVVLRNVPMALTDSPLREAVVPNVDKRYRAMFLSLQSLGGRLVFAALLYVIALLIPDPDGLSAQSLSFALWFSFITCVLALIVLYISRRAVVGSVKNQVP